MNLMFNDLLEFVLKEGHGKVFLNMSEDEILTEIVSSFTNGFGLYHSCPSSQRINGLVIFIPNYKSRIVHVRQLLCTSPEALKQFVNIFSNSFPNFSFSARRRGKLVRYSKPKRFIHLIQNYV